LSKYFPDGSLEYGCLKISISQDMRGRECIYFNEEDWLCACDSNNCNNPRRTRIAEDVFKDCSGKGGKITIADCRDIVVSGVGGNVGGGSSAGVMSAAVIVTVAFH
jgi:hypothetical protein